MLSDFGTKKVFKKLQFLLEKVDYWRDRLLFPLLKKYWPPVITPNQLTIIRVFIGITLAFLLFSGFTKKSVIVPLFCFGLILDLLDGSIARALNKKTQIGAIIDPIADKILILPIAIYALIRNHLWLLLFLLLGDLLGGLISLFRKTQEPFIEANIFGKTKMVLQSFAFAVILVKWPFDPPQFSITLLLFSIIFCVLSFIFKLIGNK